jgi:hypothetical protein
MLTPKKVVQTSFDHSVFLKTSFCDKKSFLEKGYDQNKIELIFLDSASFLSFGMFGICFCG